MIINKNWLITLLTSTRSKLFTTLIVSVYLCGIMFWQSNNFKAIDPIPAIKTLNEKAQRLANRITTGLHINSFPTFSFNKNDFVVDGLLWFKFQNGTEALKSLESFTFQHCLITNGGDMLFRSAPIIKLLKDHVLVCYHIQVECRADLNHKNFPFGSRRLTLIMQNRDITPRELYFESSNSNLTIAQDNLVQSWRPALAYVKTGYVEAKLLENHADNASVAYPVAVFSIDFENVGTRDLISLYFPMFVLFLIALFCLLIDVSDTARLGYVAAAVPILVLFRMVIDSVSPDVGYTTHLDFMYNLFVFLSLVILFFQTYVVLRLQNIKKTGVESQANVQKQLSITNDLVFFGTLFALAFISSMTFFR